LICIFAIFLENGMRSMTAGTENIPQPFTKVG